MGAGKTSVVSPLPLGMQLQRVSGPCSLPVAEACADARKWQPYRLPGGASCFDQLVTVCLAEARLAVCDAVLSLTQTQTRIPCGISAERPSSKGQLHSWKCVTSCAPPDHLYLKAVGLRNCFSTVVQKRVSTFKCDRSLDLEVALSERLGRIVSHGRWSQHMTRPRMA